MRALSLLKPGERLSVLCLGAHSDDIEIGAGGTILTWVASGAVLDVHWCVASACGVRHAEALASAKAFLGGAARFSVELGKFRDAFLPYEGIELKYWVQAQASRMKPDVVLTHRGDDAHQDHRVMSQLAWNTFRDSLILEFEIPKWDGDIAQPNAYYPVFPEILDRKIALLEAHFGSQRSKDWFDAETFRGLARQRGIECRSRYAEAFWARKMLIGMSEAPDSDRRAAHIELRDEPVAISA